MRRLHPFHAAPLPISPELRSTKPSPPNPTAVPATESIIRYQALFHLLKPRILCRQLLPISTGQENPRSNDQVMQRSLLENGHGLHGFHERGLIDFVEFV